MADPLEQVAAKHPFTDYQDWWPVGDTFIRFMSQAIVSTWEAVSTQQRNLEPIQAYVDLYHRVVYNRQARPDLVEQFVAADGEGTYQSGEFDALSYAFYRAAFEQIASQSTNPTAERRRFTVQVGAVFFQQLHDELALDLPAGLKTADAFEQLQTHIQRVGDFLVEQGYLRDHFGFVYEVAGTHGGQTLQQTVDQFMPALQDDSLAYALYEMGYPIILPSAVYLYETMGEAQHHSSRTIEELFKRVGYHAAEVDDFDPREHPSELVIELWEIRPAT